jgi:Flp pilus assembly protein TadG
MRTSRTLIRGPQPDRSGAAAVEFAIVLPLLVLLVFGCVDLGRSVGAYIIVSNAARVGAEYGATHGYTPFSAASWQSQIIANVTQEMQGTGASFDPNRLTITVTATPTTGNLYRTTVLASYRFDMLTSVPGLPQEFSLSHSVTMDRYR